MHRFVFTLANLFAFVGCLSAASPNPADLAVPPETHTNALRLVEQLGSEAFAEREAAEKELEKLGRLARPALLKGANTSPDPEVRHRCSQLLPKANALDLQAKIDTFLADTNGKYEHDLPGWNQFLAVVRNDFTLFGHTLTGDRSLDQTTKAVFTQLIANPDNRRLMVAAAQRDFNFRTRVSERRAELYNQKYGRVPGVERREPTLEDITVLLFAESLVPNVFAARNASISTLVTASGLTTAARDTDEKGRVYRAVAGAWLVSRRDPRDMYYAMTIGSNLNMMDEVCHIAVRLLTSPGVTVTYRGRAATNLINYGGKQHVRLLEKAMTDKLVVYTVRVSVLKDGVPELQTFEIQVRDLALATSILLMDQKLEDYGFTDRYGAGNTIDARAYSYSRFYFQDQEARDAAFKKWDEWRKKPNE